MSDGVPVKKLQIAEPPRRVSAVTIGGFSLAIGLAIFFWLSEARAAHENEQDSLPKLIATADNSPPAPAPVVSAKETATTTAPLNTNFIPNSAPVTLVASNPSPVPTSGIIAAPTTPAEPLREKTRTPTLIIDLAQADVPRAPGSEETRSDSGAQGSSTSAAGPLPAAGGIQRDPTLSDTERFSARVGKEEVEVATARQMTRLDTLIPQGAIIGGVMETALNSDLPGFARAIVQRDVRSFDGSTVLIPAGSRIIGQYKSGIAQGASRIFVLWTRLIRPDGVTIELASPAVDDLGRAGIGGKVNRHFLQRFGGAILTSVLSAGLNAAAASASRGSTIIVASSGQAANLANLASQNADIPPTITTRQGASIRIFVARDLDFSRVGPVR